jgi:hypothetical protein
MVSSGLLRRVALVRTDVSEESGVFFIRVTKIGELDTTQAATSNRRTLRRNTKYLVFLLLTRATRRNNPEDTILHSHRRENLKSYILLTLFVVRRFYNLMAEAICYSERRFLEELRGVMSHKTGFYLVTAVKTSYLSLRYF